MWTFQSQFQTNVEELICMAATFNKALLSKNSILNFCIWIFWPI